MKKLFSKIVDVKPNELRALWLGFAFHFIILTAYYIVKPIRDSIAAGNRLETLPWMFTATLVVMVIANTIFAAIVARMERRKFIPFAYAFFILVLVLFFPNNFTEGTRVVPAREQPIGGTAWSGITHIARSPYLFGLAAAIMLYTTTSTWAYFQQTSLAREALKTSMDRTVFLSNLEI